LLPSSSTSEFRRLQALASYEVLDTVPEDDYDAITQIAAHFCQAPISLITLVDQDRQWFKSAYGLSTRQTVREISFCHHAIQNPTQLMEVSNALVDERFVHNPLVTGDPHIVFYAGVPLVDAEGYALGTLCVLDHQTRHLSPQQATVLHALARQVVTQLQLRRSQAQLQQARQTLQVLNERLLESNQVLSTVVNTCPVGLERWRAVRDGPTIIDFESIFTNPVKADLDGLPSTQRMGHSLKKLFPHPTTFFDRLVSVVQTNQSQRYQEQRPGLNQNRIWQDVTLTPCGDGVLCTAQDITQLKETEHQLRTYSTNLNQLVAERTAEVYQLSALQQAILHQAGMAIVSTDVDGLIQTVNPAAQTLLGYPVRELIGNQYPMVLACPEAPPGSTPSLASHLDHPVRTDTGAFTGLADSQAHECIVLTKDGRQIPVLLVNTALHDEAGALTGYVSLATDISPQKKMELMLHESLQREQALNQLKSQFVSTASHEFRTPLTTIQSSVDLIRMYQDLPPATARAPVVHQLGVIQKEIEKFSTLLSDLLTIGKIEAGKLAFTPRWVDLVVLVEELIAIHFQGHLFDERRLTLRIQGTPRPVYLDETLMSHVLVNLLSNAFKFSRGASPCLCVDFEAKSLVLAVTDTGIGIPAGDVGALFQPFFRARNTAGIAGTGLGLVIARQFIALHGGHLRVESVENQGTTFTIYLPREAIN
jgi:PAS domain S-box-containing protein